MNIPYYKWDNIYLGPFQGKKICFITYYLFSFEKARQKLRGDLVRFCPPSKLNLGFLSVAYIKLYFKKKNKHNKYCYK